MWGGGAYTPHPLSWNTNIMRTIFGYWYSLHVLCIWALVPSSNKAFAGECRRHHALVSYALRVVSQQCAPYITSYSTLPDLTR